MKKLTSAMDELGVEEGIDFCYVLCPVTKKAKALRPLGNLFRREEIQIQIFDALQHLGIEPKLKSLDQTVYF